MPMPILDPSRYVAAVLADPSHKLPLPGRGRTFLAAGETVDSWDPFYAHLLADGSLKPAAPVAADEPASPPNQSAAEETPSEASPPALEQPVAPAPAQPAAAH